MIDVVTKDNAHLFHDALRSFFALRYTVFVERLGWDLDCLPGDERDQFDNEDAIYLLRRNERGEVVAGARMLRTDRPALLTDVFSFLVDGDLPRSADVWEVTRLVVDHRKDRLEGCGNVVGELLTGLLEFGADVEASHLVSVSDVRIERILRRSGWTQERLGGVFRIGTGDVAAEIQEVSAAVLGECRRRSATPDPVLDYHTDTTNQTRRAA
ncbi:MAG: GNAT family N-acetyltransferase [Magnetospirillum sp.]|nr:GNAT family N-acetyltransferase [Magnetospirillum sp.]